MIPDIHVDKRAAKVSTMGGSVKLYIDGEKIAYRECRLYPLGILRKWNSLIYQPVNMNVMWRPSIMS